MSKSKGAKTNIKFCTDQPNWGSFRAPEIPRCLRRGSSFGISLWRRHKNYLDNTLNGYKYVKDFFHEIEQISIDSSERSKEILLRELINKYRHITYSQEILRENYA